MRRRAAVLQATVAYIVHAPDATVTLASLQALVEVPIDAAERIVKRLVAGGVLVPLTRGVWVSKPWAPLAAEPRRARA